MSPRSHLQIWHTISQIPPGKVASYGQIADLAGLPGRARLVGQALQQTPTSMRLPWHRVLRSDRSLAFAAGSAQALTQRQLLLAEGVVFKGNKASHDAVWRPDLAALLFELQY